MAENDLNVNFNLRKTTSKVPERIYLVLRWNGNKYRYPTNHKILPEFWDLEKQRVRDKRDAVHKVTINKNLNDLAAKVTTIHKDAVADNRPITKEFLKETLDLATGRKVIEKQTFWNFVNNYIDASLTRINYNTGKRISTTTISIYKRTRDVLKEFEKESRRSLDFDNIDKDALIDLKEYLASAKNYSANTIAKHFETLRNFLNEATENGIVVNRDYLKKGTKAKREEADTIYLTEKELQMLAALSLDDNQRLEKVRDLFLIGAYTALRFSDFIQLQSHHFKGDFIALRQTKTGDNVTIPVHPKVKELFEKYKGAGSPQISNQKFNDYIKEVCLLAGLTEKVEITQTKGAATVKKVEEKYKLVSSHTARRSCATNLYKRGLPIQTIMAISGHKTEKSFRSYVRLSKLEHAEMAGKVWEDEK